MLNLAGRQPIIYCDFDGTVTTTDVTDVLLEELADPEWKVIEDSWVKGDIDDCQCMASQISLIKGKWSDIVRVLDTIKIDAHFKSFIELCKNLSIPIYIGSNGIDGVIAHILNREDITVNGTWAYRLIETNGNWSLEFPENEPRGICQVPASTACKCALLERSQLPQTINPYRIVIGDSKSDFCWAHKADLVFAKAKLLQYCVEHNINHLPFTDFSQINEQLTKIKTFN